MVPYSQACVGALQSGLKIGVPWKLKEAGGSGDVCVGRSVVQGGCEVLQPILNFKICHTADILEDKVRQDSW